jgi:putative transposase
MIKINKRRNTNRIPQHDYSTPGQYFVTICAENRQELFGTIENDKMVWNDVGNMINIWWQKMFRTYQNRIIDEYIIMPNHIHGIINIVGGNPCVAPMQNEKLGNNQKISNNGRTHGSAPTISDMIKWFKTMTTNQYIQNVKNNNWIPFNKRFWQRNFYDHIIRNDKSLNNIREYIINNPAKWDNDEHNPNNGCI